MRPSPQVHVSQQVPAVANPPPPAAEPQEASVRVEGAELGADWLKQLQAWWDLKAFYPKEASDKNVGGTVKVHLWINPDGVVWNVDVAQSSGSAVLDEASFEIFHRAASGAALSAGHRRQPRADITISMHYVLRQPGAATASSKRNFTITNDPVQGTIVDTMQQKTCTRHCRGGRVHRFDFRNAYSRRSCLFSKARWHLMGQMDVPRRHRDHGSGHRGRCVSALDRNSGAEHGNEQGPSPSLRRVANRQQSSKRPFGRLYRTGLLNRSDLQVKPRSPGARDKLTSRPLGRREVKVFWLFLKAEQHLLTDNNAHRRRRIANPQRRLSRGIAVGLGRYIDGKDFHAFRPDQS